MGLKCYGLWACHGMICGPYMELFVGLTWNDLCAWHGMICGPDMELFVGLKCNGMWASGWARWCESVIQPVLGSPEGTS